MRQSLILVLAIILLGLISWAFWPTQASPPIDQPNAVATSSLQPAEVAILDAAFVPAGEASRGLRSADDAYSYPSWTTPPDRQRDLHGIVLGPDNKPFAGAMLKAWRPAKQGMSTLDLVQSKSKTLVGETISNLDGEFRIQLHTESVYDLSGSADGLTSALIKECQAGEKVVVQLAPQAIIFGQVKIKKTGKPLEGCSARIFGKGGRGKRLHTLTDEDGRYRLEGLAAGEYYLEVSHADWQMPDWQDITIHAGKDQEFNFELEEGFSLQGVVVNANTKEEIADAEVSDSWVFGKTVRTNSEGKFLLRGLTHYDGEFEIHARANGYGVRAKYGTRDKASESFIIELLPAHTVVGVLLTSEGKPVDDAYVAAVASADVDQVQQIDWKSSRSEANGRFLIKDVRADIQHTLQVRKQGYGTLLYELPFQKTEPIQIDMGVIYLPSAGSIGGVIVNEDGEGVAGLQVLLTGWNADRGNYGRPPDGELDHYVGTTKLRSDDLGRFNFPNLAAGEFKLEVKRSGMAQVKPIKLEIGIGENRNIVEILVPNGGEISGVVLNPDGEPYVDAYVRLRTENSAYFDSTGVRTGANGEFKFSGLIPGEYGIAVSEAWGRRGDNEDPLLPISLAGLRPGQKDLELQFRRGQTIRGQVVDEQGIAIREAVVRASQPGARSISFELTDADGKFSLRVPMGEVVDIHIEPPYGAKDRDGNRIAWTANGSEFGLDIPAIPAGTTGLTAQLPWRLPEK